MLIPKYLIKKRYLLYGTLVSISVILLLCVQNWVENATPVSYTHLDVYKRQYMLLLCDPDNDRRV